MPERPGPTPAVRRLPVRLVLALGAALVAAVLLVVAAVDPVDGADPAFGSLPLLVVLALLPVVLAAGVAASGRPAAASGVLAGVAAVAVGRGVVDLQLAIDPALAARPELLAPQPRELAASGLTLTAALAGHGLLVVAGVLGAAGVVEEDAEVGLRSRQRVLSVVLVLAGVLALGLLQRPYTSDDAALVDGSALDGPRATLLGTVLIALGALVAAAMAATTRSAERGRGTLLGVAVGVAGVALPPLVAAVAVDWLHWSLGPLLVLVAAAGMAVVALRPLRSPRTGPSVPGRAAVAASRVVGWHGVTGVLALVTAVCAVVAAQQPFVVLWDEPVDNGSAQAMLMPAGVVVGVVGVAVLVPRIASVVRPVLSVLWVAVVVAGISALAGSVSGAESADVSGVLGLEMPIDSQSGAGVGWTVAAVLTAPLTAVASLVAGVVDREDAERPVEPMRSTLPVVAAVAALAVGAFVLPAAESDGASGPAVLAGPVVTAGAVVVLVAVVLGALAVVPWSRPVRAVALLAGVATVALLRATEPVWTGGSMRIGAWLALGCGLAAAVAITQCRAPVSGRQGDVGPPGLRRADQPR